MVMIKFKQNLIPQCNYTWLDHIQLEHPLSLFLNMLAGLWLKPGNKTSVTYYHTIANSSARNSNLAEFQLILIKHIFNRNNDTTTYRNHYCTCLEFHPTQCNPQTPVPVKKKLKTFILNTGLSLQRIKIYGETFHFLDCDYSSINV